MKCNTQPCPVPYYNVRRGYCTSVSEEECRTIAERHEVPFVKNSNIELYPHGCYHKVLEKRIYYNDQLSKKQCSKDRICMCSDKVEKMIMVPGHPIIFTPGMPFQTLCQGLPGPWSFRIGNHPPFWFHVHKGSVLINGKHIKVTPSNAEQYLGRHGWYTFNMGDHRFYIRYANNRFTAHRYHPGCNGLFRKLHHFCGIGYGVNLQHHKHVKIPKKYGFVHPVRWFSKIRKIIKKAKKTSKKAKKTSKKAKKISKKGGKKARKSKKAAKKKHKKGKH